MPGRGPCRRRSPPRTWSRPHSRGRAGSTRLAPSRPTAGSSWSGTTTTLRRRSRSSARAPARCWPPWPMPAPTTSDRPRARRRTSPGAHPTGQRSKESCARLAEPGRSRWSCVSTAGRSGPTSGAGRCVTTRYPCWSPADMPSCSRTPR